MTGTGELIAALRDGVEQAIHQIEYLHSKFQETATGNAVLARLHALRDRAAPVQDLTREGEDTIDPLLEALGQGEVDGQVLAEVRDRLHRLRLEARDAKARMWETGRENDRLAAALSQANLALSDLLVAVRGALAGEEGAESRCEIDDNSHPQASSTLGMGR